MSKEALAKVVQRAISDAGFRRQLSTDPAGALRGFGLTADESAAIRSGDPSRLSALGVDQRMSKAFALGGVAATKAADIDISGGGPTLISSGTDAVLGSADVDGGNASSNALVTGDNTSDSNALIDPGVVEGHTVLVGYTGTGTIIPSNPADVASADASDGNVLTSADAGMPAVGAQADAWVTDEGHESVIGYDPSHLASADSGFTSGTYSGDDIAGPSAGLSSTADAGGASPSVEPGDTPEITP